MKGLWDTAQARMQKRNPNLRPTSEMLPESAAFGRRFRFCIRAGQSISHAGVPPNPERFLLFHLLTAVRPELFSSSPTLPAKSPS